MRKVQICKCPTSVGKASTSSWYLTYLLTLYLSVCKCLRSKLIPRDPLPQGAHYATDHTLSRCRVECFALACIVPYTLIFSDLLYVASTITRHPGSSIMEPRRHTPQGSQDASFCRHKLDICRCDWGSRLLQCLPRRTQSPFSRFLRI